MSLTSWSASAGLSGRFSRTALDGRAVLRDPLVVVGRAWSCSAACRRARPASRSISRSSRRIARERGEARPDLAPAGLAALGQQDHVVERDLLAADPIHQGQQLGRWRTARGPAPAGARSGRPRCAGRWSPLPGPLGARPSRSPSGRGGPGPRWARRRPARAPRTARGVSSRSTGSKTGSSGSARGPAGRRPLRFGAALRTLNWLTSGLVERSLSLNVIAATLSYRVHFVGSPDPTLGRTLACLDAINRPSVSGGFIRFPWARLLKRGRPVNCSVAPGPNARRIRRPRYSVRKSRDGSRTSPGQGLHRS